MQLRPRGAADLFRATLTAGLAALLAITAVAPGALADHDPRTVPKQLDVPPDHPWRHDTRLALATAKSLPGRTAAQARPMAVRNLVASSPLPLRRYVHVGPLHRDRFTITLVGDQACAIWHRGRPHTAVPGPCGHSDRIRLRHPLQATARVLGFLIDDTLAGPRGPRAQAQLVRNLFSLRTLANLSWTFAPHGVGVTGFIDHTGDRLDDDARITLHGYHHAVCVRFAVERTQQSTYSRGICHNLAPRRVPYPPAPR